MRVYFKQSASFGGKEYKVGSHEVSKEVLAHKFFHKMIKAGLVVEEEAKAIISPASLQEKQARLAEKLMAKAGKASSDAKASEDAKAKAQAVEEMKAKLILEAEAKAQADAELSGASSSPDSDELTVPSGESEEAPPPWAEEDESLDEDFGDEEPEEGEPKELDEQESKPTKKKKKKKNKRG